MIGVREYRMTDYFDVSRILEEAFGVTKANVNPDNNYKEYVSHSLDLVLSYCVPLSDELTSSLSRIDPLSVLPIHITLHFDRKQTCP